MLLACVTLLFPAMLALVVVPAGSAQAAPCSLSCLPPPPCTVGCSQPSSSPTPGATASASASPSPSSTSGTGSCGPQPGTPACLPGGSGVVSGALDDLIINPLTDEVSAAVVSVLTWTLTFWLDVTPIQSLQGTGGLLILPIAEAVGVLIAILLLIVQGIKTMLARKSAPLVHAFEGVGKLALYGGLGVTVVDSLIAASNALTSAIYQAGFGGASTSAAAQKMVSDLLPTGIGTLLLLNFAVIALLVGLVQAGMLYVRMAALPIQVLMMPIGAAGQIGSGSTQQWMPKIWASILAVIAYKPIAMAILAVGYDELTGSSGLSGAVLGLVTLVLSVLAMPTLTRIFTPLTGSLGGSGGPSLLGVAGEAMMMRSMNARGAAPGASGGGGSAAGGQASAMASFGPAASVIGSGTAIGSTAATATGGAAAKAGGLKGATAAVGGPAAAALIAIKAAEAVVQGAARTMAGGGGQ
jgi:hypothetical protein